MSDPGVRASGLTTGDEIARDEAKQIDRVVEPDGDLGLTGALPDDGKPEDIHTSLTPGWKRMNTAWTSADAEILNQMRSAVDTIIKERFAEAFELFYEINATVRTPVVNTMTGEVQLDEHGVPLWERDRFGRHIEDWTKLTGRDRENFLYKITVGLFRWEQRAADLLGEALFARASFEEAFSHGYEDRQDQRATIEDRTARARILAADHRYRAVYLSYLSRRADAVVRSADRLGQRLKDIHTS